MKELETELRSWKLRRPSAKLEERLFASRRSGRPEGVATVETAAVIRRHHSPSFRLGWLAPVTAAMLLICALFNQRNSATIAGSFESAPMVALMMSNQSAAAYLPASLQREHNSLSAETFDWTNGSGSTSSMRSLSTGKGATYQ